MKSQISAAIIKHRFKNTIVSFRKPLFLVLIWLCSSSVGIAQQRLNFLNMPEVALLKDSGLVNSNNSNNKIFLSRKVFTYKPTFSDSAGQKYCALFYNEKCIVDKQIPCIDWRYTKTAAVDSGSYPITSIRLYVYENKLSNSLSETQTLIKYDYYNNNDRILLGEQTGIVEDSSQLFIHPPRSYAFSLTEFNPFVALRLPLQTGKKWQSFIDFPISYLRKAKLKNISVADPIHFDFAYEVTGEAQVSTQLGLVTCTVVRAKGTSELGKTTSTFFYNEQYGVVDAVYENIDKSTLRLQLMSIASQ